MHVDVVTNILKVLFYALGYANFLHVDSQVFHHHDGIVVSTVGGTKARHGNTYYTLSWITQLIERFHANEQGERGIQSTADTHDDTFTIGMNHAFSQSHDLNIENLLTTTCHVFWFRYKWQWVYLTFKNEITRSIGTTIHDGNWQTGVFEIKFQVSLRIHVSGVGSTLWAQSFHVNLCGLHLIFHDETVSLDKQFTILVNHGISTIDYILGTLTKATTTIHISRNGTCTLLCKQRLQVIVLANQFVTCGEVEDDVCTCQRQRVTGWYGSPNIFTNLNAKKHPVTSTE